MYGQRKIHKANYPLRETVDSTGSLVKEVDRFISKILKKYVGKTEYYVKNSAHFVSMIKDMKVEEDEVLVSYDITALYPSVPQDEAIDIIHKVLRNDENLDEKNKYIGRQCHPTLQNLCKDDLFCFQSKTVSTN